MHIIRMVSCWLHELIGSKLLYLFCFFFFTSLFGSSSSTSILYRANANQTLYSFLGFRFLVPSGAVGSAGSGTSVSTCWWSSNWNYCFRRNSKINRHHYTHFVIFSIFFIHRRRCKWFVQISFTSFTGRSWTFSCFIFIDFDFFLCIVLLLVVLSFIGFLCTSRILWLVLDSIFPMVS